MHYNEGAVSTSVHIEVSSCDDPSKNLELVIVACERLIMTFRR